MSKKIGCYDCGLEYEGPGWVETIVPHSVWDLIRPNGAEGTGGLLCITCICKRLEKLKLENVPVFICGIEPIIAITNHVNSDYMRFVLENWKPKSERQEPI